jgi:hypothetical protein
MRELIKTHVQEDKPGSTQSMALGSYVTGSVLALSRMVSLSSWRRRALKSRRLARGRTFATAGPSRALAFEHRYVRRYIGGGLRV